MEWGRGMLGFPRPLQFSVQAQGHELARGSPCDLKQNRSVSGLDGAPDLTQRGLTILDGHVPDHGDHISRAQTLASRRALRLDADDDRTLELERKV